MLDCHIHITKAEGDREAFRRTLEANGVQGGVVLSLAPVSFNACRDLDEPQARLENAFWWTEGNPNLFPFYWIDPTEPDAAEQVAMAVQRGIAGFKIICSHFYPRDDRAMNIYALISRSGKPILFHSGILWDGADSSRFNTPREFECLLDIPNLKFALAHVSWPWCDECLAVYGKFLNAKSIRPDVSAEMFIDTTPGTPFIYRREVLTKMFTIGYDIMRNVVYGSDCVANNYNPEWVTKQTTVDKGIFAELGLGREVVDGVFGGNLRRFLGLTTDNASHRPLMPAES